MLDMCHFNNRIVGGAEMCTVAFLLAVFSLVMLFFAIFTVITFV